jgi:two-component system NtrC family response regulator
VQQKKGKFEYAQHGTLFLDEVGELPVALQVKLLRFLQDRKFERVGGRQPIEMDVRIMAATNVDLKRAIEQGTFREDLYYRLGVINIHLPPLRDREEDALILAMDFLRDACRQNRKRVIGFTKDAVAALKSYAWPGNVRELCNKIRRAVVMAEGRYLTPEDLDLPYDRDSTPPCISLRQARKRMEADVIAQAFMLHQGNLRRAAAELGISRPTLYRLLRQYGLAEKVRHAC